MAAQLGLEWAASSVRLVELRSSGKGVSLSGAVEIPAHYDPSQAEAVGAELKARLRSAGISGTTTIGVLRREHLLVRDVRYPSVPDEERPSLIQFQALKEITLPPDEAEVDFLPLGLPWPTGEQRALAIIARHAQLEVLQRLASAAGLKLEAVVPSSLAVLANGEPALPPQATTAAFLADGELLVVHQREIIFTRALDVDEPLANEIRRSLASYQSQFPRQPIQELFIAGAELPAELEAIVGSERMPVRWYDPLAFVANPSGTSLPTPMLYALGAAQAKLRWRKLPFDFLHPKKDQPKPNKKRFYAIAGGSAAAAIALLLGGGYWLAASEVGGEIRQLQEEIATRKKTVAAYGNLEERANALDAWRNQEMVVLDELYELAARFPDAPGIRILRAEWAPPPAAVGVGLRPTARTASSAPAAKQGLKPIGQLVLTVQADSAAKLESFKRALDGGHWSVDQWERDQAVSNQVQTVVKVFPLRAQEYTSVLELGTHKTQPGEVQPEGTRGRFGGRTPTPNRGGRP